ncbi:MAG: hypothetical protein AAF939_13815, partial [Planctomycetota bacterium]
MQAIKNGSRIVLALTCTWMAGFVSGQTTPSQIYQPTKAGYQTAPPSVHVQTGQSPAGYPKPEFRVPKMTPPIYNREVRQSLNSPPKPLRRIPAQSPVVDPNLVPTNYQEPIARRNEPSVPKILRGSRSQPVTPTQQILQNEAPPTSSQPKLSETTPRSIQNSIDKFAPAMKQIRIGNEPLSLTSASRSGTGITPLRTPQASSFQAPKIGKFETPNIREFQKPVGSASPESSKSTAPTASPKMVNALTEQKTESTNPIKIEAAAQTLQTAKDFIQPQKPNSVGSMFDRKSTPKQTAMQMATLENNRKVSESKAIKDYSVQPASSTSASDAIKIQLSAPSIQVEAIGPETIGINKPAKYEIVVRNNSTTAAERILVGVSIPNWVDLENISLTSGDKEITDGKGQARLVWSVDTVPGNSVQTMTLRAVPRKAEVFDVGVEWTLVPRVGKTDVTVTEPKLEMSISGPKEV